MKRNKAVKKVDGNDSFRINVKIPDIYKAYGGIAIEGRELENLKKFVRKWNAGWKLAEYDTMDTLLSGFVNFFCAEKAIEVLVMADTKASGADKKRVLDALRFVPENGKVRAEQKVVSFDYAREFLGYSSKAPVYAAVRNGTLKAYYGGRGGKRATGIILDSLNSAVEMS